MQVIRIRDGVARCRYQEVERDVDLFLVAHESIDIGDYVLVHVGYAIAKIAQDDALQRIALFEQVQTDA